MTSCVAHDGLVSVYSIPDRVTHVLEGKSIDDTNHKKAREEIEWGLVVPLLSGPELCLGRSAKDC